MTTDEAKRKTVSCEFCKFCRFPRSDNDNWGNCRCKSMKYKTIDVSVSDGHTPEWCPVRRTKA